MISVVYIEVLYLQKFWNNNTYPITMEIIFFNLMYYSIIFYKLMIYLWKLHQLNYWELKIEIHWKYYK